MDTPRYLVVTLDTEVDKDRTWRVADPASFDSVCVGIPELLTPLFDEFEVVPTYLLSAEVIEDPAAASVLRGLGDRAELGTHLHAEFVAPQRRLHRGNMSGEAADAVQLEYPSDVEQAKLEALTNLFQATFGYRPTSFRAGRFALSRSTLGFLAGLGYRVDSSVTPGVRWRFPHGVVDYAGWTSAPSWQAVGGGEILELPVAIQVPNPRLTHFVNRLPMPLQRVARKLAGPRARPAWLRPSWASGPQLVEYVEHAPDRILVLMFHSMEVIPGASPYAETEEDVARIICSLRHLFEHCVRHGISFCGLTEAAAYTRAHTAPVAH
jgi:hypothetical protein